MGDRPKIGWLLEAIEEARKRLEELPEWEQELIQHEVDQPHD